MLVIIFAITLQLQAESNEIEYKKVEAYSEESSSRMISELITKEFTQAVLDDEINFLSSKANNSNEFTEHRALKKTKKNSKAVKLARSTRVPFGIWYDPVKWKIANNFNSCAEFCFSLTGKESYAFMINESVRVPKNVAINFLIENVLKIAEYVDVLMIEDRMVNGLPVTYLRIDATIMDVDLSYMIYLYCGQSETIQLFTFSDGSNFKEMESFLNGFSKLK